MIWVLEAMPEYNSGWYQIVAIRMKYVYGATQSETRPKAALTSLPSEISARIVLTKMHKEHMQSSQVCFGMQVIVIGSLLFSVVFGVGSSQLTSPYTSRNPKKVYLHHTHHLVEDSGGLAVNHSTWDVVGIDSVPVRQALPKALANRQELRFRAREHINLYPVNNFMQVTMALSCLLIPAACCQKL